METIRRIESTVPLDTPKMIVAFMKELLAYQLWATENNFDLGLPPIKKVGSMLLHKPYVDTSIPTNEIKEFAWVLGLNTHLYAVYIDLLAIGDIHKAHVPPSAIFRGTAIYEASNLVLVHNHPSGDITPSSMDMALTKKLYWIAREIERPLTDHIIMGKDDTFHSFLDDREKGINYITHLLKEEAEAPAKLKQKEEDLQQVNEDLLEAYKTNEELKKEIERLKRLIP